MHALLRCWTMIPSQMFLYRGEKHSNRCFLKKRTSWFTIQSTKQLLPDLFSTLSYSSHSGQHLNTTYNPSLSPPFSPSHPYNFPFTKFAVISLPVILVVAHNVGKSNVLENVSAYPNGNMGGIQPLAYSSAKHALSILYCLTSPRCRWCTEPTG